jgi:molybdate transport system ATP-binding protein
VAGARALAREPAVLLLDEPFAAVDRTVRRHLQDEIDAVRRTLDVPVILVTHDFEDVVRLATHVLLLEQGCSVAYDSVAGLTSRPDLPWLRGAVGLGAVFDGRVARADAGGGLVEVDFAGGTLLAAETGAIVGSTVRVRIPAREVILATRAPEGLSLHNVVAGTVSAIHAEPTAGHAVVQVAVGQVRLLSEVTRDAVGRLDLAVGGQVYALIKSVSVDVDAAPTPTNLHR